MHVNGSYSIISCDVRWFLTNDNYNYYSACECPINTNGNSMAYIEPYINFALSADQCQF